MNSIVWLPIYIIVHLNGVNNLYQNQGLVFQMHKTLLDFRRQIIISTILWVIMENDLYKNSRMYCLNKGKNLTFLTHDIIIELERTIYALDFTPKWGILITLLVYLLKLMLEKTIYILEFTSKRELWRCS